MRREEFEHLIAAAASAAGEVELVVIGSQAILGTCPDAPEPMLLSQEADVYPLHAPEKAIEIDGALGDGSRFQEAFGYYAHGVGPETPKAPSGWQERLVRVEIPPRVGASHGATAYCMEVHDLVLAKCAAERDRDWDFAKEAIRAGIVRSDELVRRIANMPVSESRRALIRRRLGGMISNLHRSLQ